MIARTASVAASVAAALAIAACGGGGDKDGGSDAATPVKTHPFVGVTVSAAVLDGKANLDQQMTAMRRAGVTTVRVPFYWRVIEPRRGERSFGGTDRVVAAAARHKLALLPVVVGTPAWAAADRGKDNSPPQGTATYAAFMRALVGRYGPKGSLWKSRPNLPLLPIRDWQIWNEPNHLAYWSDQPFARGYVALLRAAHKELKAADPGSRTVLAGFPDRSWDLLRDIYRAGGKGTFDVAAVHPYTFEPDGVLKIVGLDRDAMRKAGDADTPLWLTEITWTSGKGKVKTPLGFETTEAGQAARLAAVMPKLAARRKALGIGRIYWETWASDSSDPSTTFAFSGLRDLSPSGQTTDKPAFAAFSKAAKRLSACGSRSVAGVCP